MNQGRVLTKAIAEQCLKETTRSEWDDMVDKEYLNDKEFLVYTDIEEEAARLLSQHPGGLGLGGLTTLTDAAAELLANRNWQLPLAVGRGSGVTLSSAVIDFR